MQLSLVAHPERREMRVIMLDDEAWRTISTTIFGRKPELPRIVSSKAEFEETFAQQEYKAVLNYVLRRLAAKQYASNELQKLLKRHLVSEAVIDQALAKCREQGYLNDDAWLESVVRGHLTRGRGPQAIVMLLGSKGFSAEKVHRMLEKLNATNGEQEQIMRWLKKRFRDQDLANHTIRHKAVGFLFRKGFDLDAIREALASVS